MKVLKKHLLTPMLLALGTVSVLAATLMPQATLNQSAQAAGSCPALLNHTMKGIDGKARNLCQYQGKVVLVVNTASMCGFTPQYKGLQSLYERYRGQGLIVLGFPANNFAGQEPGSDAEISKFCKDNYSVSFPMFAKTPVLGAQANPLFKQLTQKTGKSPVWNFHKYLIDRKGNQVLSFDSSTSPDDAKLRQSVERLLKQ